MTSSQGKYEVKVNGEEFQIDNSHPTAAQILAEAYERKLIVNSPDSYILSGEKGEYKGNDRIDLAQDNVFLTIPIGPTPVAL